MHLWRILHLWRTPCLLGIPPPHAPPRADLSLYSRPRPPGLPRAGCLPAAVQRPATAVLLALGGLLPAAAVYWFEARARERFLAARHYFAAVPAAA